MQRVSVLISRAISAAFSSVFATLKRVTCLTAAVFFHIVHILSHIMRVKSPHLCRLLFLVSKYILCMLEASTPHIFCILSLCIHLLLHLRYFASGITPCLCHCIVLLLSCLRQLLLQTTHILPPVLTFSLHHLFQYVNLFLVGVNGVLIILCLMVCLGFEVSELMLHICHSPLQFFLCNYIGPFILVVIFVCNGCMLAFFSPLDAILLHFYIMESRFQALGRV